MNKSDDERFCELAHKRIAKEAQQAELAELQTMLENNPELKGEFAQIEAEAALAKEILPLMDTIQCGPGGVPQVPMDRLRREVRNVFEKRKGSQGRLRQLLSELQELITGGQGPKEQESGIALVRALEDLLLGAGRRIRTGTQMLAEEGGVLYEASAQFSMLSVPPAGRREQREPARRKVEVETRENLRLMEERLSEAMDRLASCNDEVRTLLQKIRQEREALRSAEKLGPGAGG